jgi:hypothetical protein
MEKILIERFENDPNGDLGRVAAESGRWEVLIDADNVPHLYVETNVETDGGEVVKGMFCIEDMMHDGMGIADLMLSTFGGQLSPEDEQAAVDEWQIKTAGRPCPRRWAKRPSVLSDPARYPAATVAEWPESRVREVYAGEQLPATEDVATMRTLLGRLRGGMAEQTA